ncbi:MAG: polysaccharide export protein, partial [Calditrichaeota bacterium]|nr:polysaccharide export protein [Calditrichota bacterium]
MILPSLIRSKPDLTVLSAVTLISLLVCSLAFGQIPTGNQDPLENLRKLSDTRSASTIALEATVDPAKYVLGPGDKLTLSIWGDIELTFKLNVSPEGSVSIPAIGSVKISGLTIADAEKLLIEKSRSSYSKADISLELIGIRMMKVSISGAVKEPGVYTISAIDRLSSLIQLAKGLYDPEVEILPEVIKDERKALIEQEMKLFVGEALKPSTRKIVIIDLDNKTANVDYLRYQRTGNLKYNPILKGGDQISVKRMDSGVGVIQVFGAVMIPGEYEFVDGDNLSGIIEIAGGFQSGALLSEIAILRFEDGNTKRIYVDLSNVASDNGGYLIRNDDRIFVRRQLSYRQKYHVEIKGEVNFPGTYPIEDD